MLNRKHLSIPYALFLLSFVVTPLVLIIVYSITTPDWNLTINNYKTVFTSDNVNTLFTSLFIAIITTIVCLLIGYPLAYLLADRQVNKSKVFVYFFVMPMWINFVLRSNATKELLDLFNINASNTTGMYICVFIAMVYDYLPFVILPLYSTMLKLDKTVIEAARDLGAKPSTVFVKTIIPLTMPGIISASTMVFMPTMCSYVITDVFSNQKLQIMGNLINQYFNAAQWNYGSAASIVLLVILFIIMRVTSNHKEVDESVGGRVW
ncbi:MAG: ABC transporter permease [Erysipelotrichaceae bacterium]|nr:ABC transporter permease [Erysipelotrichaceae bacterium]